MLGRHPPVISRKSTNTSHVVPERRGVRRGNKHLMLNIGAGFYWEEWLESKCGRRRKGNHSALKGPVHTKNRNPFKTRIRWGMSDGA